MKLSKKLRVIVEIIALAIYIFLFFFDFRGAYPGMSMGEFCKKLLRPSVSESYHYGENAVPVADYYIYSNTVGRVVVAESDGEAITKLRTHKNKAPTHFSFLFVQEGMDAFHLIQAAGTPDRRGVGIHMLMFELYDNTHYNVHFDYDTRTVKSVQLVLADGTVLSDSEFAQFRSTIIVIYIAAAVILGVILVLLIKIPNAIRKRKALPQTD